MHRIPKERPMGSPRIFGLVYCAFLASWIGAAVYSQSASGTPAKQGQPPTEKQAGSKEAQAGGPALPRRKKLVLKDGSFQLVRNYQRTWARVPNLSAARSVSRHTPPAKASSFPPPQ